MGAQLDFVEHRLQPGIIERVMAARNGVGEAIERRTRHTAGKKPVAHLIKPFALPEMKAALTAALARQPIST